MIVRRRVRGLYDLAEPAGLKPAMQVTSCEWNAEHPKWFPPGSTGNRVMLIAAVAKQQSQFHIATLDVTALVRGH